MESPDSHYHELARGSGADPNRGCKRKPPKIPSTGGRPVSSRKHALFELRDSLGHLALGSGSDRLVPCRPFLAQVHGWLLDLAMGQGQGQGQSQGERRHRWQAAQYHAEQSFVGDRVDEVDRIADLAQEQSDTLHG